MDRVERPSFPPLPTTEKENDGDTHSDTIGCCDSDDLRDNIDCGSADRREQVSPAPATDRPPAMMVERYERLHESACAQGVNAFRAADRAPVSH